jgi:hypothetical protein
VAFDQNVAAIAMHPMMGDPTLAMMGRTVPAAGNPDVMGAVPAVVAIDPDEFRAGAGGAGFNNGGGRSYADHDLRKRGGRHQSSSEQQSWKKFLHVR